MIVGMPSNERFAWGEDESDLLVDATRKEDTQTATYMDQL
jgi:hypothetical protein